MKLRSRRGFAGPATVLFALSVVLACQPERSVTDGGEHPAVPEATLEGTARTSLDSPQPTAEQLARRERSLATLKALGVPSLPSLPVVEDEAAVKARTVEELAQRCIAVAICAVKGETGDQTLVENLLVEYRAVDFLSPVERAFAHNPAPTQQELADHAWGYEGMHVLLWALGYLPELKPPSEICDVPLEVGIIRTNGTQGLASNAHPRGIREVLIKQTSTITSTGPPLS